MNFTQVAGHLGADPEERRTPTGKKVWRLRIATKVWSEGKEDTLWWDVSVWGEEFDSILKVMKKGSAICVIGSQRKPRIWTDREQKPQVTLELTARIVSFSPFGKSEQPRSTHEESHQASPYGDVGAASSHFGAATSAYRYESPPGVGSQDEEMPF